MSTSTTSMSTGKKSLESSLSTPSSYGPSSVSSSVDGSKDASTASLPADVALMKRNSPTSNSTTSPSPTNAISDEKDTEKKKLLNSDVTDPLEQRRMREENEFIWANFSEPHAERRRRIFAKYGPEIKKLMVIEWKTKWIAFAVVVTQMTFSYTLPQYFLKDFLVSHGWMEGEAVDPAHHAPWYTTWLPLLSFAWLVGGALSQNMFLGIHEISHNTAFRSPMLNDLLCMWCNFIIAVPFAMVFKTYHQEHHRYLGWEGIDTDLPEHLEAWLLRSRAGKVFFCFFQTLFYALRPMLVRQFSLTRAHYLNWAVMLLWWVGQYLVFGPTRFAISWLYCLFSSVSTGMFHPTSGHFISEHYVFNPDTFQETYSYYGLGNIIGWNVGYHNEHHDFPSVPWSLLPKIKEIAPEFYEPLECTKSWTMTLIDFLRDDRVSEYSRVKRERGAGRRKGPLMPTTPEDNHTPAADPVAMRAHLDDLKKRYPYGKGKWGN